MFERYREIQARRAAGEGEGGFTLIELLIVIVVLGILAAVVIFGLSGVTGQSKVAACNADAKSVEVAVEAYHAQQGTWPASIAVLTNTVNGVRYLRQQPSNTNDYAITLGGSPTDGSVMVQPLNGSGAALAAPNNVAANFDTASPNPCSAVQ